ncbi:MAG: MazG family protein [Actinobacteria bacterium]|nr:MazG family protein [Actinomycetota bacterium]
MAADPADPADSAGSMTNPTDALRRAVLVMDRLRSPGGCPWDAAQTHLSLARYLLEETYETLEAIETADYPLLREELGDLLLQVLFHARLASELPAGDAFSIDDVAIDLVDKLVRRHPHVFTESAAAATADEVNENWERLKSQEKGRTSVTDGVPLAQPALALAGKLVSRVERAGLDVPAPADSEIGSRLFAVVRDAVAAGVDPEAELRRATQTYRASILDAEQSAWTEDVAT